MAARIGHAIIDAHVFRIFSKFVYVKHPCSSSITMSFNIVLRAPVRRAVFSTPFPKAQLRTSLRRYSTPPSPPPGPKSKFGLYATLGVAAIGGVGFYLYSSNSDTAKEAVSALKSGVQVGKAKAHFTPTKEDYQKVRGLANISDSVG